MAKQLHTNPGIAQKPPLGVMPEFVWLERRITELSRGIDRQLNDVGTRPQAELLLEWARELHRHAERLKEVHPDQPAPF